LRRCPCWVAELATGDLNATVTDDASLDELMDKIKDELRSAMPFHVAPRDAIRFSWAELADHTRIRLR
jgi:hypothetical protein